MGTVWGMGIAGDLDAHKEREREKKMDGKKELGVTQRAELDSESSIDSKEEGNEQAKRGCRILCRQEDAGSDLAARRGICPDKIRTWIDQAFPTVWKLRVPRPSKTLPD